MATKKKSALGGMSGAMSMAARKAVLANKSYLVEPVGKALGVFQPNVTHKSARKA